MSSPFIIPSSPLSGLGLTPAEAIQEMNDEMTPRVRVLGAAGLAVGGVFGFFAMKQYKKGNQGWAAALGLLAITNFATGGYSVATGKSLY